MLHTRVWGRACSGLGEEVSLALGCVTSFHSENRRFRSARGGSREGGRAFEGAHGKDTDRGGGRSSHLPPPRERPTGGGVRSTSGADHRPAGGSPRSRGGGYKVTLVSGVNFRQGSLLGSYSVHRRPPLGSRDTSSGREGHQHGSTSGHAPSVGIRPEWMCFPTWPALPCKTVRPTWASDGSRFSYWDETGRQAPTLPAQHSFWPALRKEAA